MSSAPATVGVFDAGIGGIPLAANLARRGHTIVYLGDAARRPYGPQPNEVVASYVAQAEAFFAAAGCDGWVIACNTASVVAGWALQGDLPCIDMVSAVEHELPPTGSGPVGLLATAGTVASNAYPVSLATYEVHQVATEQLLRLAEEGGGDDPESVRRLAREAFDELRNHHVTDVVLACTDFTCVLPDLEAEAEGLRLIDPLTAAVQLLEERLRTVGRLPKNDRGHRLVLTGPHPTDVVAFARDEYDLLLPEPEYLSIARRVKDPS